MKDIKIGKLLFIKSAILKTAFFMFTLGIFLGGLIASKREWQFNFNYYNQFEYFNSYFLQQDSQY